MGKLVTRALTTAASLAALLALARPAAADCNADEVLCGGTFCISPDEICCVDNAGNQVWVCYHGTTCADPGMCWAGAGETQGQEISDANGAPYGPSPDRSCAAGRGDAGGGAAMIGVAGLLVLLARRRTSTRG
jgi:hypothetical protein